MYFKLCVIFIYHEELNTQLIQFNNNGKSPVVSRLTLEPPYVALKILNI